MPKVEEYQQRTLPSNPGNAAYASPALRRPDVSSVFDNLSHLVGTVMKADDDNAKLWAAEAMSKVRLDWQTQLIERQSSAQSGADGFTPSLIKDYDEYLNETLGNAPSAAARKYLHHRMAEYRTDLAEKAMTFEAQARIDYRSDVINNAGQNLQKLMNTDPGQYEVAVAELNAVIDSTNIPPIKKSELRQKMNDSISSAAVWSSIQRNPSAFLDTIGLGDQKFKGEGKGTADLKGVTGFKPFDDMPYEKRIQMVEKAYQLKNQMETDHDRRIEKARKVLEDDSMKEAFDRLSKGTLKRDYIESIRPFISHDNYKELLTAQRNGLGGERKDDPAAFAQLQTMLYGDHPEDAAKEAFALHRAGRITNSTLSSVVGSARSISRAEGPKSPYERMKGKITKAMDPGPFVQDPVGRARAAEAIDDFDRWFVSGRRTDEEVQKYGDELLKRYKFIDLGETVVGLPQPRSGQIRRNTQDIPGMTSDLLKATNEAQAKYKAGKMTKQEYDAEMALLNRWRKTLEKNNAR